MIVPNRAVSALAVDLFNAAIPVGWFVLLEEKDGTRRRIRTISKAHLVSGRFPRVKLAERVGWVDLARVLMDGLPGDATKEGAEPRG